MFIVQLLPHDARAHFFISDTRKVDLHMVLLMKKDHKSTLVSKVQYRK